jgi:hypothetical protein
MELSNITITTTELILFVWAAIATGAMFKFKDEARVAKMMLMTFITNEDARTQVVEAHNRFTKFREKLEAHRD